MIAFKARPYSKTVQFESPLQYTTVTLSGVQIWSQGRVIGSLQEECGHILAELMCQSEMVVQLHCVVVSASQGLKHTDQNMKLYANLYGPRSFSADTGYFLEKCQVYLQHPKSCDRDVPYVNPHHLVDPEATVLWTQHLSAQLYGLDDFISPSDLLADLTSEEALPEAKVPSVLQTELFRQVTFKLGCCSWHIAYTESFKVTNARL